MVADGGLRWRGSARPHGQWARAMIASLHVKQLRSRAALGAGTAHEAVRPRLPFDLRRPRWKSTPAPAPRAPRPRPRPSHARALYPCPLISISYRAEVGPAGPTGRRVGPRIVPPKSLFSNGNGGRDRRDHRARACSASFSRARTYAPIYIYVPLVPDINLLKKEPLSRDQARSRWLSEMSHWSRLFVIPETNAAGSNKIGGGYVG
jgi:hypothetical protein